MIEKFNDKMKIRISRPLVTETSDYYNIVDIFKHRLTDKNRLYVFMGHGSDHFANAAYPALDYHFKNADMNNVFVGTVEGFPDLETVISHAIKTDIKNVTLLPFMLVCGDHAKNDMAVEWKEEFENNVIFKNHIKKVPFGTFLFCYFQSFCFSVFSKQCFTLLLSCFPAF